MPSLPLEIGAVTTLWRYPVSSLGGEQMLTLRLAPAGADGDRTHALVDIETGKPIDPAKRRWQFAPRLLARVGSKPMPELSFDGCDWFRHDNDAAFERLSDAFQAIVELRPYGGTVSEGLTEHRYKLAPVHLLSTQALADMRRRLPESHIDERRFRPNLVVDFPHSIGQTPPEYELIGQEFRVGSVRLRGVRKAGRCSFTTLQQAGLPEDREVLKTLVSDYERDFGIYCEVLDEGLISVGDRLTLPKPAEVPNSIVIVGAGQAAASASQTLRECGFHGSIKVFGNEKLAPYERPALSKSLGYQEDAHQTCHFALPAAEAAARNIDLHLDETVVQIDRTARLVLTGSGDRYRYDRLIIATGGSARTIPKLNRGHGRIFSLRTSDDALRIQQAVRGAQSVFVLGAGWLGLELAAAARQQGKDVTLFGRHDQVCPRVLPKPVAEVVETWHREQGVRLQLACDPNFTEHSDYVEARIGSERMQADMLILAIGIVPNDNLARQAGLDCDDGILTDQNGATRDPFVFAVGDVARQDLVFGHAKVRLESWQNANDQAARAAHAVLDLPAPDADVPRFWSEQFGHTVHIAGLPDASDLPVSTSPHFWEYRDFAIGIDQPMRVHQFANRQTDGRVVSGIAAAPDEAAPIPSGSLKYELEGVVDLPEGELRPTSVEGVGDLLVTRLGNRLLAFSEQCPHASASLAEGIVDGFRVICPLHFAEFDMRDGTAHRAPAGCPKLQTFSVTMEDGKAFLWVPHG